MAYTILIRMINNQFPSWDHEKARASARQGRYGQHNVNRSVYKSNCDIFRAKGYRTSSGKLVSLPDDDPMIPGTEVYDSPQPLTESPILSAATKTSVVNRDSMLVAKDMIDAGLNPAVLNLASAYHACGGYDKGSSAQEESLCRVSTLSRSLYQYYSAESAAECSTLFVRKAYPMHIRYGGIYSPGVTVFRDMSNGFALLEEPYQVAVISVAALNFRETNRYANDNLEYRAEDGGFTPEGSSIMHDKIRTIFRIALNHGHDSLVLGAFGCGAFRLPTELVAGLFKEILEEDEFDNRFREVRFAILENCPPWERGINGKFAPFYKLFDLK